MTAITRFLFALLLGILLGAGGTVYVLQSDAGNLVVGRTQVVQDLERRLREMEQQRDQLSRQLEAVTTRAERMEQSFGELERRFRGLAEEHPAPAPPARPEPPSSAP